MENYVKELINEFKETKKSYSDMIDFCCDNLILNNYLIEELGNLDMFPDIYCGTDVEYFDFDGNELTAEQAEEMSYDDYEEHYIEFYQYYIISERDAERLATYTNETVFYFSDLDLYLLAVSHYGMSWKYVSANWKEIDND